jgi:hypothetical protein
MLEAAFSSEHRTIRESLTVDKIESLVVNVKNEKNIMLPP